MKAKSLAPLMKVGYDLFNQLSINQTVKKNKYSDRNSTVINNYGCSNYKDTARGLSTGARNSTCSKLQ